MIARALVLIVALLLFAGCASAPRAALREPPHAVELEMECRIATMHFRAGVYVLQAADNSGWFYRAPERVLEHSFGGSYKHEGGIFLARDSGSIRGYVVWAGGRSTIGSISSATVRFL